MTLPKLPKLSNVCYDALRIRSEPETCNQSTDCYDDNAECIYSLAESHHICCKPRPDAIFPGKSFGKYKLNLECPAGREMLIVGKYMPILCSLTNSVEDDMCPKGYECVPSATGDDGEPYHICCMMI
uniref:EB domain-containing protein n=1 Tax=Elaeophora elaphi TaxID=1147741 RepID=A0A0R3S4K6_9BILA